MPDIMLHCQLASFVDSTVVAKDGPGWACSHQTPSETAVDMLLQGIGGRKGGAMGLQPYMILRVLHRILTFTHRNIFLSDN